MACWRAESAQVIAAELACQRTLNKVNPEEVKQTNEAVVAAQMAHNDDTLISYLAKYGLREQAARYPYHSS